MCEKFAKWRVIFSLFSSSKRQRYYKEGKAFGPSFSGAIKPRAVIIADHYLRFETKRKCIDQFLLLYNLLK